MTAAHASKASSGVRQASSGRAVVVGEAHRVGVHQEDVEVAPGLTRRLDGLLGQVDRAVDVGEAAGLLAPSRGRQDDVGELGGLGEEQVLHDHEALVAAQDPTDARGLRHRHRGVGGRDPQEPDRPGLGVGEDLHRMGGRRPVRDRHRLDVPRIGELLHVRGVVPVAEARQVAVRAALPVVLGGRLPVHLQHARTGTADHAAQQVEVVHGHGGRGRLMRLVEALQHRRQHRLALTEDPCRCAQVIGRGCRRCRRCARACRGRLPRAARRPRSCVPSPSRGRPSRGRTAHAPARS